MQKVIGILSICIWAMMAKAQVNILEQSATHLILDVKIATPTFKQVNTPQGLAYIPQLNNSTPWQLLGAPDLPKINVSLQIPSTTNTYVTILHSEFTETQMPIAPSKGKIVRPNSPQNVPYTFGKQYQEDTFYPQSLTTLNTPYVFRDKRGQALHIAPMQFNAVTNTLRTYTSLRLLVSFSGENPINALSTNNRNGSSPLFTEIHKAHFLNDLPNETTPSAYTAIGDKGSMLVLCPTKYLSHIKPFVEWKNQKGISTTLVNVDTIAGGPIEDNIRAFVKNYYLSKLNTFLLIVGNVGDVPTVNQFYTDTSLHGPGDNAYGYINGADHYPEIIVARLMARDSNDIKVQVQKVLSYEKTPNMTDGWMHNITGIASGEGTGDDNQYDFEHIRDICDSALNQFTYTKKIELYDGDRNQADAIGNPSATDLVTTINDTGTGIINYAGHGDNYFITTTAFSASTHVPMLTNTNGKLPFMITVGCKPGNFIPGNCLAASGAWAKDANSGLGTGFIVSAMSTVDQYWNEPMQAQDEINAVLRGARPSNIKYTIGGACVDGYASMNDQYNIVTDPTGGSDMTDTWQIFGDPSVELLTNNEGTLPCISESLININATTFTVTHPTNGALVTLYYNEKIIDTKLIAGGTATFTIPAGLMTLFDNITVTVTKHNMIPCQSAVQIINYAAGINDIQKPLVSMYPNPVTDIIAIESNEKITNLTMLDITGKLITQQIANSKTIALPMSHLTAGIYVLQVTSNGIIQHYKVHKL